jgi:hypothetical protein
MFNGILRILTKVPLTLLMVMNIILETIDINIPGTRIHICLIVIGIRWCLLHMFFVLINFNCSYYFLEVNNETRYSEMV